MAVVVIGRIMSAASYRLATEFKVQAFFMEEEWLLYHTGSGETHRLSGVAVEIFTQVWNSAVAVNIKSLEMSASSKLTRNEIVRILESLVEQQVIESVGQID